MAAAQGLSGVIFKYLAAPSVLLVGIAFRLVADPCFAFSTKGWQAYILALLVAISSLQSTQATPHDATRRGLAASVSIFTESRR